MSNKISGVAALTWQPPLRQMTFFQHVTRTDFYFNLRRNLLCRTGTVMSLWVSFPVTLRFGIAGLVGLSGV